MHIYREYIYSLAYTILCIDLHCLSFPGMYWTRIPAEFPLTSAPLWPRGCAVDGCMFVFGAPDVLRLTPALSSTLVRRNLLGSPRIESEKDGNESSETSQDTTDDESSLIHL